MRNQRVLFLMSGSIAAYKACHVLSRLRQQSIDIEVVASPAALRFVGEATIEGLTGRPVRKAMFGSGAHMAHIELIRWADLAIVCPATASTIGKLASGIGDDLLTTLFLAHDFSKPWLIAPAMNAKMYHHPTTRASTERLRAMGCEILETASGVLACGEIGDGKLLDPDLILKEITQRLATQPRAIETTAAPSRWQTAPANGRTVLITSGGTEEPIDPVRSITNTSTGATGAVIAETFLGLGHRVIFLSAEKGLRPRAEELGAESRYELRTFRRFIDLERELTELLGRGEIDAVIQAAAISDYSLASGPSATKLDSSGELVLRLTRNPKLVAKLREWAKKPDLQIIAFKLTSDGDLKTRVKKLIDDAKPDWIVGNELSQLPAWSLFDRSGVRKGGGHSREELAFELVRLVEGAASSAEIDFPNDSLRAIDRATGERAPEETL